MCFSPYLGITSGGEGGGVSQGIGTQLAYAVFHPRQLNNRSFRTLHFWHCDHLKWPSQLSKACFRPYLRVVHPIWVLGPGGGGGGGGVPRDWYTTCLCSFSPWAAQKLKFSKVVFLISWSPKMTKVCKACFRPYLCVFHPIWVLRRGERRGVSQGIGAQLAYAVFHPRHLKNRSFRTLHFGHCDHLKWPSQLSKACFRPYLRGFHPIWVLGRGGGGGSPKGLVHNLLMQLFTLGSSKIEVLETFFLTPQSPKMTIPAI